MSKTKKTYFLSIWPTNTCNRRCHYCFYEGSSLWDLEPQNMSTKVADGVIDFINSGQVEGISFFGGEPLFNWPIVKRILTKSHLPYILKAKGMKHTRAYNITTNGTLLTPEILEDLKLHDVFMNISFDGTKETQDKWRDNSYDDIIKNLDIILDYPDVQILKTMSDPTTLYEDVKHIRDLGFKRLFINLLDPYGHDTYEKFDVDDFKRQYRRVIETLDSNEFMVGDYHKWKDLIKPEARKSIGCGFSNKGLCVDWKGNLWPCHQGPSMSDDFIIGDIWNGIDPVKEEHVRNVLNAPICEQCHYKFTKCYVSMYNKHGKFGVDPPEYATKFETAKIQVIEELNNFPGAPKRCLTKDSTPLITNSTPEENSLLIASLMSREKLYMLKPFLDSLMELELPIPTDFVFLPDADAKRAKHLLRCVIGGTALGLPKISEKFRKVTIAEIPVVDKENFMFRIARGRNISLGIARKGGYSKVLFLDTDIVLQENTIPKLMDVDADIVGALVMCRRADRPGWYNNYIHSGGNTYARVQDFTPGEILPVDATGCDCVLIHRRVFMDQKYQYKPELPEAEDIGFCMQAKRRGFITKIHTGILTQHVCVQDMRVVKT